MSRDDDGCGRGDRRRRLVFRDPWTAGRIYRSGEAVPHERSRYVAPHLNQNDPPPSANRTLVAARGDQGAAGAVGARGAGSGLRVSPAGEVTDIDRGSGGTDLKVLSPPPGGEITFQALGAGAIHVA
ncbi:MAG: hypothetical protein ABI376_11240 [Caulobacteraceae bacterium]